MNRLKRLGKHLNEYRYFITRRKADRKGFEQKFIIPARKRTGAPIKP